MSNISSNFLPSTPLNGGVSPNIPPGSVYNQFQKRFIDLSKMEQRKGIKPALLRLWAIISGSGRDRLNFATHMTIEHYSQGCLAGNSTFVALRRTRKLVSKIDMPHMQIIKNLMVDAYSIRNTIFSREMKAKNTIKNLKVGASTALSVLTRRHHVLMTVTRTADINGKKTFTIEVHNTGKGVENYHYQKLDKDGRRLYQTALRITNVPEKNLYGKNSQFFERLLEPGSHTTKTFYENILPLTGGEIDGPSPDERDWGTGQLGGSCTTQSLCSAISSHLPVEEHTKFKEFAAYELLLKTVRHIFTGSGNSTTQKLAALEMINEIQRTGMLVSLPQELVVLKQRLITSLQDKAKNSPLDKVKTKVQALILAQKKATIGTIILNNIPLSPTTSIEGNQLTSSDPLDSLNFALTILKDKSPQKNFVAYYLFLAGICIIQMPKDSPVSQEFIKKFTKLSEQITDFHNKTPLGTKEIHFMLFIALLLQKLGMYIKKDKSVLKSKKLNKVLDNDLKFYLSMHLSFNVLKLNSNTYFWKTLFGPNLKFTYSQKDSQAEKGMEAMKTNMANIRKQNI